MFSGVRNKSLQMCVRTYCKSIAVLQSQKTNHTDTCVCHFDTATDTKKSEHLNLRHLSEAEDLNTTLIGGFRNRVNAVSCNL